MEGVSLEGLLSPLYLLSRALGTCHMARPPGYPQGRCNTLFIHVAYKYVVTCVRIDQIPAFLPLLLWIWITFAAGRD